MFGVNEIDSATLKSWQEAGKSFRLLDVRSHAEFTQGMIQDGEPMPLNLIPLKTSELNTEQDIILYCRSGARSAQACAYLMQNGFERVYNLRGGIMDWVRGGNHVVAPAA